MKKKPVPKKAANDMKEILAEFEQGIQFDRDMLTHPLFSER